MNQEDRDTLPPEPDPKPVLDAIDAVSELFVAALNELRNTVIEHYQRTTARLDDHERRLRNLETQRDSQS